MLSKNSDEDIKHFLMDFPFTMEVWKEALSLSGGIGKEEGPSLIGSLKQWIEDPGLKDHKALPCVVSWAIW